VSVQKIVSALGDATAERKCTTYVSSGILTFFITENCKSGSKNPRKRPAQSKTNSKAKRPKALVKENLQAAKLEVCTSNGLLYMYIFHGHKIPSINLLKEYNHRLQRQHQLTVLHLELRLLSLKLLDLQF
jgi:hypothetical protein